MGCKYVSNGMEMYHAHSASVSEGDLVVIGTIAGVAQIGNGANNATPFWIHGVFCIPKTTGEAWSAGDMVMWDVSASKGIKATTGAVAGDLKKFGLVLQDAASTDDEAHVMLTPSVAELHS